jgi:hypothetical protein
MLVAYLGVCVCVCLDVALESCTMCTEINAFFSAAVWDNTPAVTVSEWIRLFFESGAIKSGCLHQPLMCTSAI